VKYSSSVERYFEIKFRLASSMLKVTDKILDTSADWLLAIPAPVTCGVDTVIGPLRSSI
jgi:hypothetical protein